MSLRHLLNVLLLLGGFYTSADAQGYFTYKGKVDSVYKDGFYYVDLAPPFVAHCRADLGDVRLLGPDKRFVSYVLKDSRKMKDGEKTFIPIPGAEMKEKDSTNKHSYLRVVFQEAYEM